MTDPCYRIIILWKPTTLSVNLFYAVALSMVDQVAKPLGRPVRVSMHISSNSTKIFMNFGISLDS